MGLNKLQWIAIIAISITISIFLGRPDGHPELSPELVVPYAIGGMIGFLLFPAIVVWLVMLGYYLFKSSMPEKIQRNVFFIIWIVLALANSGRIISGDKLGSKREFIDACKKAAADSANGILIKKVDIDKYCNCAYEKIKSRTDIKLEDMKDRSSPMFNEVIMACLSESMFSDTSSDGESVIIGYKSSDTIQLINSPRGNRIKIYINGNAYYFVLDNGASDVVINGKMADKLESEKLLVYNTDGDVQQYEMADGNILECKLARIKELHIGHYVVTNIKVAVQSNDDTDFLLGKSFLEIFHSWSLINNNHALVLKK